MNLEQILADAKAAEPKKRLEEYREAVEALREKGYSWRDIAEFLNERGVTTDHTRVYRTFGHGPKQKQTESRPVDIERITYIGERLTKRKRTWNIVELELPSKLGQSITLVGYVWGSGTARFVLGEANSVSFREANLVIKTGGSFPMAYVKAELLTKGDEWTPFEVYIVPKWEVLL